MNDIVGLVPKSAIIMGMKCYVKECQRQIHARGLCEMHYRRLLKTGIIGTCTPQREQRRFVAGSDEERFLKNVLKTDTCWFWTGAKTTSGYSEFQVNKKTIYAHRWSYEFYIGKIPQGLVIDHLCRNRLCVNPNHLEAVTNKENILRGNGLPAINARKTHCKNGHKLSENRRCYICSRLRDKFRYPKRKIKK